MKYGARQNEMQFRVQQYQQQQQLLKNILRNVGPGMATRNAIQGFTKQLPFKGLKYWSSLQCHDAHGWKAPVRFPEATISILSRQEFSFSQHLIICCFPLFLHYYNHLQYSQFVQKNLHHDMRKRMSVRVKITDTFFL